MEMMIAEISGVMTIVNAVICKCTMINETIGVDGNANEIHSNTASEQNDRQKNTISMMAPTTSVNISSDISAPDLAFEQVLR